jgi:hypothetical protein
VSRRIPTILSAVAADSAFHLPPLATSLAGSLADRQWWCHPDGAQEFTRDDPDRAAMDRLSRRFRLPYGFPFVHLAGLISAPRCGESHRSSDTREETASRLLPAEVLSSSRFPSIFFGGEHDHWNRSAAVVRRTCAGYDVCLTKIGVNVSDCLGNVFPIEVRRIFSAGAGECVLPVSLYVLQVWFSLASSGRIFKPPDSGFQGSSRRSPQDQRRIAGEDFLLAEQDLTAATESSVSIVIPLLRRSKKSRTRTSKLQASTITVFDARQKKGQHPLHFRGMSSTGFW